MTDAATPRRKKRPSIRIVIVILIAVLALILVFQNTETVETRILFATIAMPRAVLLVVTFLLGMMVGLLVNFLKKRPAKKK